MKEFYVTESTAHLRNVSKFFEKNTNPEVLKLRMHYAEISRALEKPKQTIGPSTACPRCGIARTETKHLTRISPGKTPSKVMKNLIRRFNDASARLPKQLGRLARKCQRNTSNKVTWICSICSESAKIVLSKPRRRKILKTNPEVTSGVALSSRKKKKRVRDRTAGLNLGDFSTPKTKHPSNVHEDSRKTSMSCKDKNRLTKVKTPALKTKPNKLNLSRLKGIIDKNASASKKSKLQTFLQELC